MLHRYLAEYRDALRAAEPGVRAGDAEAVHDMRVAARRLRSTLRTFRPLLDRDRTEPLREELRWLGRLLGAARDDDVLAERLVTTVRAEPPELVVGPVVSGIRRGLAADASRARTKLLAGLDGARYAALLAGLDAVVDDPHLPKPGRRPLRRLARRALRRADRMLADAGPPDDPPDDPPDSPPDAAGPEARLVGLDPDRDRRLHDARKAYKRARYAVEAVAGLAPRPARRLVKRLKSLQDTLGEHQDTVVARGRLREDGMRAYGKGENAFTYGLLYGRERARGERALAGLDRVRDRAARPNVRRWLGRKAQPR
jgi:CHAD domain-containing protein